MIRENTRRGRRRRRRIDEAWKEARRPRTDRVLRDIPRIYCRQKTQISFCHISKTSVIQTHDASLQIIQLSGQTKNNLSTSRAKNSLRKMTILLRSKQMSKEMLVTILSIPFEQKKCIGTLFAKLREIAHRCRL